MRREMILTKAGRERTVTGETGELLQKVARLEEANRDLMGLIENITMPLPSWTVKARTCS